MGSQCNSVNSGVKHGQILGDYKSILHMYFEPAATLLSVSLVIHTIDHYNNLIYS